MVSIIDYFKFISMRKLSSILPKTLRVNEYKCFEVLILDLLTNSFCPLPLLFSTQPLKVLIISSFCRVMSFFLFEQRSYIFKILFTSYNYLLVNQLKETSQNHTMFFLLLLYFNQFFLFFLFRKGIALNPPAEEFPISMPPPYSSNDASSF